MATIEIIRGDDTTIDIELLDELGEAIDLTGAIIYFTVKKKLTDDDDDAVLSKEVTDHIDPLEGKTTVSFTYEETEIAIGRYYWDVQIEVDGVITSTNYGIIRVLPDITRRTTPAS